MAENGISFGRNAMNNAKKKYFEKYNQKYVDILVQNYNVITNEIVKIVIKAMDDNMNGKENPNRVGWKFKEKYVICYIDDEMPRLKIILHNNIDDEIMRNLLEMDFNWFYYFNSELKKKFKPLGLNCLGAGFCAPNIVRTVMNHNVSHYIQFTII